MSAELTEEQWENFGYDSTLPCDMCGNTETKLEWGMVFHSCKEHAHIPPVFRMEVKDYENV